MPDLLSGLGPDDVAPGLSESITASEEATRPPLTVRHDLKARSPSDTNQPRKTTNQPSRRPSQHAACDDSSSSRLQPFHTGRPRRRATAMAPQAPTPTPSPSPPRPTMRHSSAFLLPSPPPAGGGPAADVALVVLNQPLPRFAPLLWSRAAALRVCADGGANRVFDGMPELLPDQDPDEVRARYKPDVIKGDMDSVRPEVKEYYSNMLCILVLGAVGGRFDHEMGNINVLHMFPNINIVLLSDACLIFLLPRTHAHEIHIERSIEGPHCGLIPIGMPSTSTTTTGLRWNLDNTSMNYGGLISTSNIVEEDKVTVTSESDLIWTVSLQK
nr:unnamed protein product [Digitaria exilis]